MNSLHAYEQWMRVELFRVATGRLPDKPDDTITETLCKGVLDRALFKGEAINENVVNYAAHRWWLFQHPEHQCNVKCNGGHG